MRNWRQTPLQNKVSLAMFIISCCVIAIAFSAMLIFQTLVLRTDFERYMIALARVTAANCATAVSAGDSKAATAILASLREARFFDSAWIELADGRKLAEVDGLPDREPRDPSSLVMKSASVHTDSEVTAVLWVSGDYGAARAELITFLLRLAIGVVLVCVPVGWFLARRAQQIVLRPVHELANAAERVVRERDLSLRVNRSSDDEIGLLTTRFNEMLSQIETQERQLKKARRDLESKVVALEFEIAERRRIEAGLAEVTQREESRLANDLHDGLGQLLTGIAFKAHLLKTLLEESNPGNSRLAADVVALANESIKQARNIAHGVAPVDLAGTGLSNALVQLGSQVEHLMGTECTITVPEETPGMSQRTAVELYRICQEAIHNGARHGRATRIGVLLEEHNSVWRLEIRDNGTGLPPPEERRDGLGLKLMAHRAESVGGTIAFVPGNDGGLIVRCAVPVSRTGVVLSAQTGSASD